MSEELESLRAEVAALRAELSEQRARSITRRRLLTGLGGLGAAGAVGVAAAPTARADDGDFLVLGQENTAQQPTKLEIGDPSEYPDNDGEFEGALMVGGGDRAGVWARSADTAVDASGGIYGVYAFGHGLGVVGRADHFFGVLGEGTDFSNGVGGTAEKGAGLYGESAQGPALCLKPSTTEGPPLYTVLDSAGAVSVDPNGDFWLCTSVDPDPSWTRLLREDTAAGRTIPITPFRALDTRATGGRPSGSPAVPGQKQGPLEGGETITLDLAGVAPIPTTATGVIGNLTAVTPNYVGYVRAAPSGQPFVSTALSFTKGEVTGNAFTAKLGPDGLSLRGSGTTSNTYDLVVDITAYIT